MFGIFLCVVCLFSTTHPQTAQKHTLNIFKVDGMELLLLLIASLAWMPYTTLFVVITPTPPTTPDHLQRLIISTKNFVCCFTNLQFTLQLIFITLFQLFLFLDCSVWNGNIYWEMHILRRLIVLRDRVRDDFYLTTALRAVIQRPETISDELTTNSHHRRRSEWHAQLSWGCMCVCVWRVANEVNIHIHIYVFRVFAFSLARLSYLNLMFITTVMAAITGLLFQKTHLERQFLIINWEKNMFISRI